MQVREIQGKVRLQLKCPPTDAIQYSSSKTIIVKSSTHTGRTQHPNPFTRSLSVNTLGAHTPNTVPILRFDTLFTVTLKPTMDQLCRKSPNLSACFLYLEGGLGNVHYKPGLKPLNMAHWTLL